MTVRPGTQEYESHKKTEIEHYSQIFEQAPESDGRRCFQPVPQSWIEIEHRSANLIRSRVGYCCIDYLNHLFQSRSETVRMLSLGSGPAGIEISLASVHPNTDITCVDFNQDLLNRAADEARAKSASIQFQRDDLNLIQLPESAYDIVFCHASLHHVIELEHLFAQIARTLRSDGQLVIVEIVTPNGYLMWPETRAVVNGIFRMLPAELRVNHTAYEKPTVDETIWDVDASQSGMECIRSEHILPLLNERFRPIHYVPYFSISRRFFDTMYGPNYDLNNPLHAATFNWIWQMDCHYVETRRLQAETFFGAYSKRLLT
jgi:SAM-dependent methyltransferase